MWKVPVGGEAVSAIYEPAPGEQRAVFVCGHGAGGNMNDRGLVAVSRALGSADLGVVRFNFVYREKKSSRPDHMPRLQECFAAVVERVRAELRPDALIIGGRSMGGRAASMLAAEGFDADGLLLLAYPLHSPGRQDKLRAAHLASIAMPVLCFNGTRDTFCEPALMRATLAQVNGDWTMHWLEGADHGFHVLKKSGRTDADVLAEVAGATRAWLPKIVD